MPRNPEEESSSAEDQHVPDLEISDSDDDGIVDAIPESELGDALFHDGLTLESEEEDASTGVSKTKRKRKNHEKLKSKKRSKFEETIENAKLKDASAQGQLELFTKFLVDIAIGQRKLSSLEIQDKILTESNFRNRSQESMSEKFRYSNLLFEVVPDLKDFLPDSESKRSHASKATLRKGGPLSLIICSSGMRCMDVIRELKSHQAIKSETQGYDYSKLKIAKLFAKHLKLEDQAKFLSSHAVHVGVGTPNRIAKLLEMNQLNLSNLRTLVLDISFTDSKKRTLFTAVESREELFDLYMKHLVNVLLSSTTPSMSTNAQKGSKKSKKNSSNGTTKSVPLLYLY